METVEVELKLLYPQISYLDVAVLDCVLATNPGLDRPKRVQGVGYPIGIEMIGVSRDCGEGRHVGHCARRIGTLASLVRATKIVESHLVGVIVERSESSSHIILMQAILVGVHVIASEPVGT